MCLGKHTTWRVGRSLQPGVSKTGEGCPERALVEERAQKEAEAGGWKEGADLLGQMMGVIEREELM